MSAVHGAVASSPVAWSNWGGNQHARPVVATPRDEDELVAVLASARERALPVKPVGSGHSFTAVAATEGVQLRLDRLTGIPAFRAPDESGVGEVTVRAGTRLRDLNTALHGLGLALPNLGDIDRQTVSGALSTGTHGTGLRLTGLAAGIRAARVALADGRVVDVSPNSDPALYQAARVGLGALGVVTQVTVAVVPRFLLRASERPERLGPLLASLDEEVRGNDHLEFYWFPHTDRVQVKRNNRVADGTERRPVPAWRAQLDDQLLSNTVFEWTNRLCTSRPDITPRVNSVAGRALTARTYVDWSHRVFVSDRDVRFVESEWAFPREALPLVVTELRQWLDRSGETVSFPVEVRVAAPDDVWLSTAHQRDSGYVAIHQFHRADPRRYFAAFEQIAVAHQGRPHWGKLHTQGPDYLGRLYPRFEDFLGVRDRVDPDRLFANDYTRQVLGD